MKIIFLTACFIMGCVIAIATWGTPASPVAVVALVPNAFFYGVNLLGYLDDRRKQAASE
jgi:hypothetical protein